MARRLLMMRMATYLMLMQVLLLLLLLLMVMVVVVVIVANLVVRWLVQICGAHLGGQRAAFLRLLVVYLRYARILGRRRALVGR